MTVFEIGGEKAWEFWSELSENIRCDKRKILPSQMKKGDVCISSRGLCYVAVKNGSRGSVSVRILWGMKRRQDDHIQIVYDRLRDKDKVFYYHMTRDEMACAGHGNKVKMREFSKSLRKVVRKND